MMPCLSQYILYHAEIVHQEELHDLGVLHDLKTSKPYNLGKDYYGHGHSNHYQAGLELHIQYGYWNHDHPNTIQLHVCPTMSWGIPYCHDLLLIVISNKERVERTKQERGPFL